MKNSTYLSSVISRFTIPETLPVALAEHGNKLKLARFVIPSVLETLEHSSSEAYISGDLELSYIANDREVGCINVPLFTRFLFTGKKEDESGFDLEWCTSLS